MPTATETLRQIFKNIANAIREKDGTTEATDKINPENYASRIQAIRTGTNTSDATATASDIMSGKTAYGSSGKITGTLPTRTTITISDVAPSGMQSDGLHISADVPSDSAGVVQSNTKINMVSPASYFGTAVASDVLYGRTFTSSAGLKITGSLVQTTGTDTSDATATASDILSGKTAYISVGKVSGSMPMAGTISGSLGNTSGANWSTSDPNRGSGKVTINVSQSAGYTEGFSGGSILVTVPENRLLKGRTVTPTTLTQTIANAEDMAYGAIKVAGDANLISSNIKQGVSIFGVSGTYTSGTNTSDATATASDIARGKTAYGSSGKITGSVVVQTDTMNNVLNASAISIGTIGSGTAKYLKIASEFSSDRLIRSGINVVNMVPVSVIGNATAADVAADKTFTSSAGVKVAGTMVTKTTDQSYAVTSSSVKFGTYDGGTAKALQFPYTYTEDTLIRSGVTVTNRLSAAYLGNASAADVVAGKTFTSRDGFKITGTASLAADPIVKVYNATANGTNQITFSGLASNLVSCKYFIIESGQNAIVGEHGMFLMGYFDQVDGATNNLRTRFIYTSGDGGSEPMLFEKPSSTSIKLEVVNKNGQIFPKGVYTIIGFK